jgi:hypothetical protein
MVERLAGQIGFVRDFQRRAVTHATNIKADGLLRLLEAAHPRSQRTGERRRLERIDRIDRARGNREIKLPHRTAPDLRQK